jgi:hypothetical protein
MSYEFCPSEMPEVSVFYNTEEDNPFEITHIEIHGKAISREFENALIEVFCDQWEEEYYEEIGY